MARGFMSGILWGGTIGVGVTAVASVLAPMPVGPEIADLAPETVIAPEQVAGIDAGLSAPAARSSADRALATAQVAPQTNAPEADTIVALKTDTTQSVAQPQAGTAAALGAPAEAARSVGLAVAADAPVIPNPQALAPMAPQPVDAVALNTDPGARPAPSKEQVAGTFDAPAQPDAGGTAYDAQNPASPMAVTEVALSVTAPQAPVPPAKVGSTQELADSTVPAPSADVTPVSVVTEEFQVVALDPPLAVVAPVNVPTPAAAETVAPSVQAPSAASFEALPDVAEDSAPPVDVTETDVTETDVAEGSAPAAVPAARETRLAQAQTTQAVTQDDSTEQGTAGVVVRRAIGTPAVTLTDRNTGVTINRAGGQSTQPEQTSPAAVVTQAAVGADQPAIKQFAETFENAENKPLMSIVLIDDGDSVVAGAEGIAALGEFPYTLSFAVDTSLQDATDRMAIYRAAGFEVMAMVDLPEGALPSDAETTLGVILPKMDEIVGVLEGTKGGLQGSRDVADQVTAILAQSGHGLLTQDNGLNTMPKLALKEGVPADPIFRDFDSKGQSPQVIRRFLDQAAFKAGQEGAVVMLGRLRPDTVSALLLWGLQDRAGQVALAPISAVLTRER